MDSSVSRRMTSPWHPTRSKVGDTLFHSHGFWIPLIVLGAHQDPEISS